MGSGSFMRCGLITTQKHWDRAYLRQGTSYGIAIRILIRDPDRHQNLIICSLAHCQLSLTISGKSVREFLSEVANRQQTDKQTNNDEKITSLAEVTMSRAAVSG